MQRCSAISRDCRSARTAEASAEARILSPTCELAARTPLASSTVAVAAAAAATDAAAAPTSLRTH